MTVILSPETQRLLDQKLQSGEYRSADEVVRAALEALDWAPGALDEATLDALDEATLDALDRAEDQVERDQEHAWKDVRQQVTDMFGK